MIVIFRILMLAVLICFCLGNQDISLFGVFARVKRAPLEMYPIMQTQLCIAGEDPADVTGDGSLRKQWLMELPIQKQRASRRWCRMPLNSSVRSAVSALLGSMCELGFESGSRIAVTRLGPDASSVFTHFEFELGLTGERVVLLSVQPSHPVSIDSESLAFSYEVGLAEGEVEPRFSPAISTFGIILYMIVIILAVALFVGPCGIREETTQVLATKPSYGFPIVVFAGAGIGAFTFLATMVAMRLIEAGDADAGWWYFLGVPGFVSSIVTGGVTSVMCVFWGLRGFASIMYLAPLIFPVICVTVAFWVQWIQISIGSTLLIPVSGLFAFLALTVFMYLPVNLIFGLITGIMFRKSGWSSLQFVVTTKLSISRRCFFAATNGFLFVVVFPSMRYLSHSYPRGLDMCDWRLVMLYLPLWAIASACVGVASVSMMGVIDWGQVAFLSASGSGFALWCVLMISSILGNSMNGICQLSMHAAITGLACAIVSLSGGGFSVLAATWTVAGYGELPD